MNRTYRRKKEQYVFGSVVVILGAVSILSFLILFLPVRADYLDLEVSIERLRQESVDRVLRLESLQEGESQLDSSRRERLRFLAARIVPRDEGFAAVLPDLEQLAQIAGIRRNQVQYDLDPVPEFGVYSVRINIPVQGPYEAVTRFIRELEGFDRVFILDSIGLNRSQTAEPGDLDLSLNLTTFFSYGS